MKLYISADIEGIAGVSDWNATSLNSSEFEEARSLMTQEVLAACKGAIKAGCKETLPWSTVPSLFLAPEPVRDHNCNESRPR